MKPLIKLKSWKTTGNTVNHRFSINNKIHIHDCYLYHNYVLNIELKSNSIDRISHFFNNMELYLISDKSKLIVFSPYTLMGHKHNTHINSPLVWATNRCECTVIAIIFSLSQVMQESNKFSFPFLFYMILWFWTTFDSNIF